MNYWKLLTFKYKSSIIYSNIQRGGTMKYISYILNVIRLCCFSTAIKNISI